MKIRPEKKKLQACTGFEPVQACNFFLFENYIMGSHRLTFPGYCLVLSSILEESFDLITGFNEIIPFSANLYLN